MPNRRYKAASNRACNASCSKVEQEVTETIEDPCRTQGHSGLSCVDQRRTYGRALTLDTSNCNTESSTPLEQHSPAASELGQTQKHFMQKGMHRALTIDTSYSDIQSNAAHESCSPAASAFVSRVSTRSETDAIEGQRRKPQQALGRSLALDTSVSANENSNSSKLQTHLSRASPKSRALAQLAWPNKLSKFPKSHAHTVPAHVDRTARFSCDQGESPHKGSDARSFRRLLTSEALDAQFAQEIAAMDVHGAAFVGLNDAGDSVSDETFLEEAWESMVRTKDEEQIDLPEFSKKVLQSMGGSGEPLQITNRPTNRVETLVHSIGRVTVNLARLRNRTHEVELLSQVLSSGVVSSASSGIDSSDDEWASEPEMDIAESTTRSDIDV